MRRTNLTVLLVMIALLVAGVTGCDRQPATTPGPTPAGNETPSETPAEQTATVVRVYLVRGEKIGMGGREVTLDAESDAPRAAVEQLLEGPTAEEKEFGLGTAIPDGTKVNGVDILDGVATVDLSKSFDAGGGSLSMLLRVTQVVCTLTQFDDVEKVAFKLDGQPVKSIGGEGIIVDPPVDRSAFEGQLPAILVEAPYPGQTVTSPLTISGSSNVFEATHQLNLTDPDGLIVAEKTITATSGTGTRGTWTATVEFPKPKFDGTGSVIAFTLSAKDGKKTDIVEIPVKMTK